jgi:two-component system response regulator FlrC
MKSHDALSDGVRALLETAAGLLPVTGLGVVRPDGPEHVVLTYVDPLGATAYRALAQDIPESVRPRRDGLVRIDAAELDANPPGLVETRLLHHGFADDIRRRIAVRQIVTQPVPGIEEPVLLVLAIGDSSELTDAQLSSIDRLARRVVGFLNRAQTPEEEIQMLRRLETVDRLLPTLFDVLDVREIFDRLSAIAKDVLRHDLAALGVFNEDLTRVELYVQTAGGPMRDRGGPMPYPPVQTEAWLYRFIDDLTMHPVERHEEAAAAGGRSSIRVAIRLEDRVLGALNFTSRELAPYTAIDLVIARRIADYVALALSHQRLADEARRTAALRERAANLEMLEDLLKTLSGVLDIREVFDRVSDIAQKVLPHDALGLPILTEDREHVVPLANVGLSGTVSPSPIPIPDAVRYLVTEPWEFEIFRDMEAEADPRSGPYLQWGYRSALRVPVRLEGQVAGFLVFLSRAPGTYSQDDVLVARRIADHVSLAMSNQRLADEARRNEALRARAEKSDLLDEVLASVTGAGELADVFDRVSTVTQKVLAHDALILTAILPDGLKARVYASESSEGVKWPDVVDVPPLMVANRDWEFDLIDDLQARPDQRNLEATTRGFRGALRMPIRLDGEYVAGVSFLSFTPSQYSDVDIPVARRIADRLAMTFLRERRNEASQRADAADARAAKLESRVRALTEELDARTGYRRVVGDSASWRRVLTQATQVAATDTTVLLLGESGTGKEVAARFVHRASMRPDGPFVALNCAALPEQLLEAELFGYERGAFTGATQSKPGQLEQAGGGTLFLDEVGEMSPQVQAKFLRVLQEREFQRLGGTRVLRTDARVVAATNRDLQQAMSRGQFREDLFYRLNVFAIHLPSLRERKDDVLPLSEAFLSEYGRSLGRPPAGISRDARKRLMDYHWPGNVRELRNILERAAILCDGGLITAEHLALNVLPAPSPKPAAAREVLPEVAPQAPLAPPPSSSSPASVGDLSAMERAMIEQALQNARFNKSKAAAALGLTRAQLYVRMKRYGLE